MRSLLAFEDGSVLAGGDFTAYGGVAQSRLALLQPGGAADPLYSTGNGNVPTDGGVFDALHMPDGKIIYAGSFAAGIICLNPEGGLDRTFLPPFFNGPVRSVALMQDGRLLVGGDFTSAGGQTRNRVAVLSPNGVLDPAFDPGGGADGPVNEVVALPDGNVVILGAFTQYGGQNRTGTARLTPAGALDSGFGNTTLEVTSINSTD